MQGERSWLLGLDRATSSRRTLAAMKIERLTSREKQILCLMLRRCTNQQIAKHFHLTLQTTKNHVGHVLKKLDCKKRGDLFDL